MLNIYLILDKNVMSTLNKISYKINTVFTLIQLNKYLLSSYYWLGTVLGSWDTASNTIGNNLCSLEAYIRWWRKTINNKHND